MGCGVPELRRPHGVASPDKRSRRRLTGLRLRSERGFPVGSRPWRRRLGGAAGLPTQRSLGTSNRCCADDGHPKPTGCPLCAPGEVVRSWRLGHRHRCTGSCARVRDGCAHGCDGACDHRALCCVLALAAASLAAATLGASVLAVAASLPATALLLAAVRRLRPRAEGLFSAPAPLPALSTPMRASSSAAANRPGCGMCRAALSLAAAPSLTGCRGPGSTRSPLLG